MKKLLFFSVIVIAAVAVIAAVVDFCILKQKRSQAKNNVREQRMRVKRRTLRTVLIVMLCLAVVGGGVLLVVNSYVKDVGEGRLLSVAQAAELDGVDCILVLGCQVRDDGSLSHMLRDRLSRALELYEMGAAPKMLMSGDHGRKEYDEVGAMKQHAVEHGVPSENVLWTTLAFLLMRPYTVPKKSLKWIR